MSKSVVTNEDCVNGMKRYPDKCFDLAVVDPPYGIGLWKLTFTQYGEKKWGNMAAKRRDYRHTADWDFRPTEEYWKELFRVSKKQIVWGGNYFTDVLPPSKSWLVWDKRCNDAMTNTFSDCELAWMSENMGVARVFRYMWNGMLQGNMSNKEERFHPTQKPVALYSWIFNRYAKQGDKVLDTHLGSGSSRIAAYDLGLDFTGFEIDPEYFKREEERFEAHAAQISLYNEQITC